MQLFDLRVGCFALIIAMPSGDAKEQHAYNSELAIIAALSFATVK